jgi:UDP-N-acetylmuramate: L-alanyl-gamma-D-glutamyl-meso-diaminopimelate ligase
MRIYILGVCGTFMAGLAVLAKQLGHEVIGTDEHVYPPMSLQLKEQGIQLLEGYDLAHLDLKPDIVVVGNIIGRGNVELEQILNRKIPYISGPGWLHENILKNCDVLAVAGTHGKTTTAAMLAWILEFAGLNPGFLVGGVLANFDISARLGKKPFFVIEADEYECSFADKRSKFVHYYPKILVLNNLEFDHADIFDDLAAIKRQFHHLVRLVPANGMIVTNAKDKELDDVLAMGSWTPVEKFDDNSFWHAEKISRDSSQFEIYFKQEKLGQVSWGLMGEHNRNNALAAIAAAKHAGVAIAKACEALGDFKNVKRRMELKQKINGVTIYDDFAHHPTAIATTIAGLRKKVGKNRIIVILELGSYTMRSGVHKNKLVPALQQADYVLIKSIVGDEWKLEEIKQQSAIPIKLCQDEKEIIFELRKIIKSGDNIVIMSNTGFNSKLLAEIENDK